jgi:hypothetical protein
VDWIICPEPGCSAPAEIVDRFVLSSTSGPVEHVQTRCLNQHVDTPLAEQMSGAPRIAAPRIRARRASGS